MALASKSAPDSTCPFLQPPQYWVHHKCKRDPSPRDCSANWYASSPVGLTTSAKTPKGSSLFSEAVQDRQCKCGSLATASLYKTEYIAGQQGFLIFGMQENVVVVVEILNQSIEQWFTKYEKSQTLQWTHHEIRETATAWWVKLNATGWGTEGLWENRVRETYSDETSFGIFVA